MKKRVFVLLIAASFMFQLDGHVDLATPEGGETFHPGEVVYVSWVEVQAHNTLNWDLLFSMDGGSSWDTVKSDIPVEALSYDWTVPATTTANGKIKIIQDNENANYEGTSPNFNIIEATGIHDPLKLVQISVYPNPLVDYSFIEFENSRHRSHTLSIYNTQGKIVRSIPDIRSGTVKVERKNLTSGLYFIRLRDEKDVRAMGKLVVE